MVAQLSTFTRIHWIKIFCIIKLLKISRINLKIKCYKNLKHSRERKSNWLAIPASRSWLHLVLMFQKRAEIQDFSFLPLWKTQPNAPESKLQNSCYVAYVCLWPMNHFSNSYDLPLTECDQTLLGLLSSLQEHRHHIVCIFWANSCYYWEVN